VRVAVGFPARLLLLIGAATAAAAFAPAAGPVSRAGRGGAPFAPATGPALARLPTPRARPAAPPSAAPRPRPRAAQLCAQSGDDRRGADGAGDSQYWCALRCQTDVPRTPAQPAPDPQRLHGPVQGVEERMADTLPDGGGRWAAARAPDGVWGWRVPLCAQHRRARQDAPRVVHGRAWTGQVSGRRPRIARVRAHGHPSSDQTWPDASLGRMLAYCRILPHCHMLPHIAA
jgi:hypothetical protein